MHVLIADSAGGAWNFGGSILTFAFPMILFVVVAGTLYVLYTKPELVPGHWVQGERPVSYTAVPRLLAGAAATQTAPPAPAATAEAQPARSEETGGTDAGDAETAESGTEEDA